MPKPDPDVPEEAAVRPLRGRPRSEDSHGAILDAVLALLEGEGYRALTIENVARQAGVGKQTIYRWWKSKPELVLEAYANHSASKLPMPDKGSLRADLEWFFCSAFKRLTDISGPTMRGLMADAVYDPEFLEILRECSSPSAVRLCSGPERGRARGELKPDADLDVVIDLLFGALWYRLLCSTPSSTPASPSNWRLRAGRLHAALSGVEEAPRPRRPYTTRPQRRSSCAAWQEVGDRKLEDGCCGAR
jgi:AcrR family transcriptional regulator